MKNNSLLLFLLIFALAGDVVLAYLLYDCMHEHDKDVIIKENAAPCTSILTSNKGTIMTGWTNFNTLNGSTDENWGAVCRDAILKIFSDTSVNALSFYICADNDDPAQTHSYSVGVVGCQVIPGTAPGGGTVVTRDNATYYTAEPWCPPQCYTRTTSSSGR